ncbi:MAG: copC [Thermoleophilia bacterium]|nr:copC [Thermoleophilia bacterium]
MAPCVSTTPGAGSEPANPRKRGGQQGVSVPRPNRTQPGLRAALLRVLVLFVVVFAAAVPSAGAHAVLIDSQPGDEATVDGSVREVRLKFNESIVVAFGGSKVWGPDGSRVDDGDASVEGGRTLVVPIDGAARGTYALSYRIVSGDGHPVRGASTFHVGARSGDTVSEDKARAASAGNRSVEVAFGVARGIALAALLYLAGAVVFAACIAPGTSPRWVVPALVLAFVGVAVSYLLDAANAAGFSLAETLRWDVVRAEASTTWGRSALVQLGLIAVLALWLRMIDVARVRTWRQGALVALPAMAPLLAWSAGGHAIATKPVWLRLPLDMLHMVAAAVWIGGLVALILLMRAPGAHGATVRRWSRVAMAAVGTLVATGLYASFIEIGLSWEALSETTYGRLVLIKALLLLATMPLAWLNQRRNVPALEAEAADSVDPASRGRLRRYVAGELAILAVVVGVTAALIQTPPAKSSIQPKLVDKVIPLRTGELQLVVDPARVGANEIHVYVSNERGRLDETVTNVTMRGKGGGKGIEGLEIPLLPSGPGHFTTPAKTIPFAGSWTFTLQVERGTFDSQAASFTTSIGKADT